MLNDSAVEFYNAWSKDLMHSLMVFRAESMEVLVRLMFR